MIESSTVVNYNSGSKPFSAAQEKTSLTRRRERGLIGGGLGGALRPPPGERHALFEETR